MTAPRRIVIHAGFHKTGTTSLQRTFSLNAATLLPHVEFYLQDEMILTPLREAVLNFSGNRCKATKRVITEQASAFFRLLDPEDPRPVMVSSESLSGHFPGSSGVHKYGPAPIAIALIRDAWADVTGSDAGFEVYYSTRGNGWLASCHWQRLKTKRATLSLEDYCEKFAIAADHEAILHEIRDRLGAERVHSRALESIEHPIDPVLDLLGLSHLSAELDIPPNANVFPGEAARDKLLALNRSNVWGDAYRQARRAILDGRA
ncbi:hypothetical protein [Celeribacter neptunius]|uniref:Sulfotransferase family protein n=1 Tax=Celeribacter neptunius TaxID=588602 RepID=A0A1I3QV09_9RHOB|nr:hypothetical protein [Celeribacter neptunius]SFJ37928.1 hypothetical protein SAMN04487991_1975 [Celeribacter neptunius]